MKLWMLLIAAAAVLPAQQIVEGEVVDSVTRAPIAGIRLAQLGGREISITDAAGHFRVSAPDNQFYLQFNRPGYLSQGFGASTAGKDADAVLFHLTPQAVIAGKIEDEDGLPVQGATVAAYSCGYADGRRQFHYEGQALLTDEAGQYRIFNLPAGRYCVRVVPHHTEVEWDARYGPQFYPDSTDADHAKLVEVATGQERGDVDIRLTKKEGVTVAGAYSIPKGSEPPRITLRSIDEPRSPDPYLRQVRSQSPDGQFLFAHVPPGTYMLEVRHGGFDVPKAGELSASQQIEVGTSDLRNLALDVRPLEPMELTGKVVFPPNVAPAPVRVEIDSEWRERLVTTSQSDGSFVVRGIFPGSYGIGASGARVTSIRLAGREVMHSNFEIGSNVPGLLEITVGEKGTAKFSASVVDSSGRPVAGVMVYFWQDGGETLLRLRSGIDGAMAGDSAPAGDYHVYLLPQDWTAATLVDMEYRKAHADDFPMVHLVAGSNAPITLQLKGQ